jgi:hypothetical protein
MPSRFDRAAALSRRSLTLAVVPFVASLVSLSKLRQALSAGGGGITFPFPSGLPTLWTYVSLPGVAGPGVATAATPAALLAVVPLFLVGLLVTSALEAGFLGALDGRIGDGERGFGASVAHFGLRMVGVNLVRTAVVLAALPFVVVPPLIVIALVAVIVLGYLTYGLPFVVVTQEVGVVTALGRTVDHATGSGGYARFGFAHLLAGAVASVPLSILARNGGIPGILVGAAIVAVPAVFVAAYGLFVFRDLGEAPGEPADRPPATGTKPGDVGETVGRDASDTTGLDDTDGGERFATFADDPDPPDADESSDGGDEPVRDDGEEK